MHEQTKRWLTRTALIGAGFGFALGAASSQADAYFRKIVGSVCQPAYFPASHGYLANDGDYGVVNTSVQNMHLICPVPNNTDMKNSSTSKLAVVRVGVRDGNATSGAAATARVCARGALSASLACGSPASSHDLHPSTWTTAHTFLTLNSAVQLAPLGSEGDVLYLWVVLPGQAVVGATSVLRSLYFFRP
jgi:hypothetical protein